MGGDQGNAGGRLSQRMSRGLIRAFVVGMVVLIAVQTMPRKWAWMQPAKEMVGPMTKRLGVWQGEWNLFAPDPMLNNAWLSAEVYAPNGELTMWNSTYWGTATGRQKFRDFRMMNLGNRLHNRDAAAHEDFADYVARQIISPTARAIPIGTENQPQLVQNDGKQPTATWRLKLYRSQLKMTLPADGSLPTRDDTVWISSSINLVNREYLP